MSRRMPHPLPLCSPGRALVPSSAAGSPAASRSPQPAASLSPPTPVGQLRAASSSLPLGDKVHQALKRVQAPHPLARPALAGALGGNDAPVRPAWPAQGRLTVGIPHLLAPLNPKPTPPEVRALRQAAGWHRPRTPLPSAPGLSLWLPPPRRGKAQGPSALPRCGARTLQRPARRHGAVGYDGHGPSRYGAGPHASATAVATGANISPVVAMEIS